MAQIDAAVVHSSFGHRRLTKRILIDGNNILIEQDISDSGIVMPQVVGHRKRRGKHAPHTHLGAVFVSSTALAAQVTRRSALAIKTDDKHVKVIPMTASGIL